MSANTNVPIVPAVPRILLGEDAQAIADAGVRVEPVNGLSGLRVLFRLTLLLDTVKIKVIGQHLTLMCEVRIGSPIDVTDLWVEREHDLDLLAHLANGGMYDYNMAGYYDLPVEYHPANLRRTYLTHLRLRRHGDPLNTFSRFHFPRARTSSVSGWNGMRTRNAELAAEVRRCVADEDDCDVHTMLGLLNHRSYSTEVRHRICDVLGRTWSNPPQVCDCDHAETADAVQEIGGFAHIRETTLCSTCHDDDAVYVEDFGAYALRDDVYYWESDDAYHIHEEPEEEYEIDDDTGLRPYSANAVHELGMDTSFKTTSTGDFHMGVELETEATYRDRIADSVDDMRDELGSSYAIYKSDGSLGAGGIEIVTKPTSLAKHIEKFAAWTPPKGLKAWDTGRCGMHVHIDSKAFTALTLAKFIAFFNDPKNTVFVRQIAGRHPGQDTQAQHYAGFDCDVNDMDTPMKVLKGKSASRYVMVNTSNLGEKEAARLQVPGDYGDYNTIEVRIFRASLRKERLLAQLEFTHALVMFCRQASYKKVNGSAFVSWLRTVAGQYTHLAKWYSVNHRHGVSKGASTVAAAVEPMDDCDAAIKTADLVAA